MPTGPDDAVGADVMDQLVQLSFAVIAVLTRTAAAHDLSLTQLRVLAILRDREPKIVALAAHLGLEKSTVSGLVDRAVGRGLIRRDISADDGRAVRVSLTAEGRRQAETITREVASQLAPVLGQLSRADQVRLGGLLARLIDVDPALGS